MCSSDGLVDGQGHCAKFLVCSERGSQLAGQGRVVG